MGSWGGCGGLLGCEGSEHGVGDGGDYGDCHRVAELAVGLGIRDWDLEGIGVSHEPGAFAGGEAAWVLAAALGDEDFAAVLVVAGAEGAGGVGWGDDAAAEAIALGLVFAGVVLEVGPEFVAQGVFRGWVGFEDGAEAWGICGWGWEREGGRLAEADEEDAFAVLGEPVAGIDDAVVEVVAEVGGERFVDDGEGASFVVAGEVLDVFEDESGGLVVPEDAGDFEEEIALALVIESVASAQGEFFADAGEAEGLAGKTAAEDVVGGNVAGADRADIAGWFLLEICLVGPAGPAVPVAREDAMGAGAGEGEAEAADAAEEVDEARGGGHCFSFRAGCGAGSRSPWKNEVTSGLTLVSMICQRPSEK